MIWLVQDMQIMKKMPIMKESMRPGKAGGMLTMIFSYHFLPSGLSTEIFMLHKRL